MAAATGKLFFKPGNRQSFEREPVCRLPCPCRASRPRDFTGSIGRETISQGSSEVSGRVGWIRI